MVNMTLVDEIKTVLRENWETGDTNIESEEVYDKLIEKGIEVPPNSLAEALKYMKDDGLIGGPSVHNREAAMKHGGWKIMWVNPGI